MSRNRIIRVFVAVLAVVSVLGTDLQYPVQGQERRRSPRRSSSVFDLLRYDRIAEELQITDEQRKTLTDLAQKRQFTETKPFADRLNKARTPAEKEKINDELAEAVKRHGGKEEAQGRAVLTDDQRKRLTYMRYRRAGSRTILLDDVVAKLEIDEQQKEKIEEQLKQRSEAWYDIDRRERDKDEVREKFRSEWDAKLMTLLSPKQQEIWKTSIAPAFQSTKTAGSDGETTGKKTASSKKPAAPKAPLKRTIRKPTGNYVASFDPADSATRKKRPVTYGTGVSSKRSGKTTGKEQRTLSFNFENAPWKLVLEFFAKKTGLSLDGSTLPPNTFSYRDPDLYTPTEALDVLNGYLIPKQYILIRRDRSLVVHNLENPVPQSLVPDVKPDELDARGRNELMRISFRLNEDVDVMETAKELEGLQGDYGKVVPFSGAKLIVVTDIGSNLLRMQKILENVTADEKPDDLAFKAFQLQHIPAADAAKILTEQLDASRTVRNVSAGGGSDPRSRFREMMQRRFGRGRSRSRGGDSSGGGGSSTTTQQTGNAAVRVTADSRTNNVLVLATAQQVKLAEGIVKSIDVKVEGNNPWADARDNTPFFKVYKVTKADATEVTKSLTVLLPEGSVINEDRDNGTIHIYGTPDVHTAASELITQMDGGGGASGVDVIPLRRLDPVAVATTLTSMFVNDGDSAPSIQADAAGRNIMVRGSKEQIAQVRTLVTKLEGDSAAKVAQQGNVRRVTVPGDPEQFLQTLQKFSKSMSPGTDVRIVIPNDPNPIRERRTPSGDRIDDRSPQDNDDSRRRTTTESKYPLWDDAPYRRSTTRREQPETTPRRTTSRIERKDGTRKDKVDEALAMFIPDGSRLRKGLESGTPEKRLAATQKQNSSSSGSNEKQDSSGSDGDGSDGNGGGRPAVSIMLLNGQLVLTSEDTAALNRMQQLIQLLAENIPVKTTWTVFYLQSADCTEAATMLELLYPTSSVSNTATNGGLLGSLTSGVSNFGSTLMDASGLNSLGTSETLRIIPEVRSNSLFVSGPTAKVRDVERILKVLDASDLPANLRDRVPRMIPVRYADVNEVASIVQSVYRDYMEGSSRRGRGSNPLAMLLQQGGNGRSRGGRNGRSSGSRGAQEVRLTLGVDTRTGQLVVSANDSLYQQIKDLVYRLDESAYKAQRTTRVVQLQNASASVVTQTLTAMYPNVSVTSNTPTPGSGSNDRGDRRSSDDRPRSSRFGGDDGRSDFRRQLLRQLQQRNQNGGGSRFGGNRQSSDSGDRGSSRFGNRGSFTFGNRGSGRRGSSRFGGRGSSRGRGGRR